MRGGGGGRRGVRRRKAPSWALLGQRRGLRPVMAREGRSGRGGALPLSLAPAKTSGEVPAAFS